MLRGDSGARLEVGKAGWRWCVPEIIQPRAVGVRGRGSGDGQGKELVEVLGVSLDEYRSWFSFETFVCIRIWFWSLRLVALTGFALLAGQASRGGGGFSGCRAWAVVAEASADASPGLYRTGLLVAPRHGAPPSARDRTRVSAPASRFYPLHHQGSPDLDSSDGLAMGCERKN